MSVLVEAELYALLFSRGQCTSHNVDLHPLQRRRHDYDASDVFRQEKLTGYLPLMGDDNKAP